MNQCLLLEERVFTVMPNMWYFVEEQIWWKIESTCIYLIDLFPKYSCQGELTQFTECCHLLGNISFLIVDVIIPKATFIYRMKTISTLVFKFFHHIDWLITDLLHYIALVNTGSIWIFWNLMLTHVSSTPSFEIFIFFNILVELRGMSIVLQLVYHLTSFFLFLFSSQVVRGSAEPLSINQRKWLRSH